MTKQRAAILSVIRSDERHSTAEEIFEKAKMILPTISRATVYNNLHAMEEEGLVRRMSGEGNSDRYDKNVCPHGHLFCKVCGGVFDLVVPSLEETIKKNCKAELYEYELKATGVCMECKSN